MVLPYIKMNLPWGYFNTYSFLIQKPHFPCLNYSIIHVKVHFIFQRLLLLLLLSCFSHVRLCATPETAAHQAPQSLGFSRQEHWSGLPLPSPMHESEKITWSHSVVSNSEWPHGLQPSRPLRPWDFPGKSTGVGCHCLLWHSTAEHNEMRFSCRNGENLIIPGRCAVLIL